MDQAALAAALRSDQVQDYLAPSEQQALAAQLGSPGIDLTWADVKGLPGRMYQALAGGGAPAPGGTGQGGEVELSDLPNAHGGAFVSGLVSALKGGATLPGDVATGKTNPLSDEGLTRTYDLAGTMMTGGVAGAEKDALGVFGGRMAKTADQAALAKAEQLASSGAPREQIWNETGWFQGPDKQWRFEIPDDKSTFVPPAPKDYNIAGDVVHGREGVASDVLVHPELYAAYPDAANMVVAQTNYGGGIIARYLKGGEYMPEMIGLEPVGMTRPTALHEMQHAIQNREGFANGGNPGSMPDALPNPHARVYVNALQNDPRLQELNTLHGGPHYEQELARSNDLFTKEYNPRIDAIEAQMVTRDDYRRLEPQIQAVFDEFRARSGQEFPTMARIDALQKALSADGIPLSPPSPMMSKDQAYRHLAGETEARNVDKRRDMTPEERRSTPPWLTQDVPDEMQIVRGADGGPQMSVGGPIRAYHGSPHDFDRFDLSKIGTGEGAQVFGKGLYFAENPEVARGYRDKLAAGPAHGSPEDLARNVMDAVGGDKDKALSELNSRLNTWLNQDPSLQTADGYDRFMKAQQAIRSGKPLGDGRMYEVAIKAEPERFLDYDLPLREQSAAVKAGLEKMGMGDYLNTPFNGSQLVPGKGGDLKAYTDAGIQGVKYLDQGSRMDGTSSGSRNFVVFDHDIVDILKKYGVGSIAALPPAVQMAIQAGSEAKPDLYFADAPQK